MSFGSSSFGLYTDSDLVFLSSGTLSLVHKTDLSDNPQDTVFYLGSQLSNRQLQANSNPGVDNIILSVVDTLPEWEATTAYVVGDRVQPTGGGNGFVYRCTDAGTSDSSEPTWPVVGIGSLVTDDGVIWELYSAHHTTSEVTLALSEGDLDLNTPGAPLDVALTVDSLPENAVEIWVRVENAVTTVSNDISHEEISISINECVETSTV
jgi:hypothetical protein